MRAKGMKLYLGDGAGPEVFTAVAGIVDFKPTGTTWDTEDTTSHDTETPVKTADPTLRDDGSLQIVIYPFDSSNDQHALLRTLSESGDDANFKYEFPGSTIGVFPFSGFVTNFAFETPVGGLQKATVSIKANVVADQAASIHSVVVSDTQAGSYVTAEAMQLTVTYDEVVRVTGTPRIAVVLGSGTVYATYQSGSGTNVLKFSKTFGGGDDATAGELSITSPAQLNGGTILDMAGNAAGLTFTPPNTSAFTVN